jgi:hypothetical protein
MIERSSSQPANSVLPAPTFAEIDAAEAAALKNQPLSAQARPVFSATGQ